jgi:hypothetical protein
MNIAEILIWEATNFLLLISLVIGLVMVKRWFQGRPVFTDRDLALPIWPATGESFLAEAVAQIRHSVVGRRGNLLCGLILSLTVRPNMVHCRAALAHLGNLLHYTEMVALRTTRSSFLCQAIWRSSRAR